MTEIASYVRPAPKNEHPDITVEKCKSEDCDAKLPQNPRWGYCRHCLWKIRYYINSENARPPAGRNCYFTAAEADVVRKRLRRFEDPKRLAREYGVTVRTINAVLKPGYNPRPEEAK